MRTIKIFLIFTGLFLLPQAQASLPNHLSLSELSCDQAYYLVQKPIEWLTRTKDYRDNGGKLYDRYHPDASFQNIEIRKDNWLSKFDECMNLKKGMVHSYYGRSGYDKGREEFILTLESNLKKIENYILAEEVHTDDAIAQSYNWFNESFLEVKQEKDGDKKLRLIANLENYKNNRARLRELLNSDNKSVIKKVESHFNIIDGIISDQLIPERERILKSKNAYQELQNYISETTNQAFDPTKAEELAQLITSIELKDNALTRIEEKMAVFEKSMWKSHLIIVTILCIAIGTILGVMRKTPVFYDYDDVAYCLGVVAIPFAMEFVCRMVGIHGNLHLFLVLGPAVFIMLYVIHRTWKSGIRWMLPIIVPTKIAWGSLVALAFWQTMNPSGDKREQRKTNRALAVFFLMVAIPLISRVTYKKEGEIFSPDMIPVRGYRSFPIISNRLKRIG